MFAALYYARTVLVNIFVELCLIQQYPSSVSDGRNPSLGNHVPQGVRRPAQVPGRLRHRDQATLFPARAELCEDSLRYALRDPVGQDVDQRIKIKHF